MKLGLSNILYLMRSDIKTFLERRSFIKTMTLTDTEKKCLKNLRESGICTVENYWSKEKCERIKIVLEEKIKINKDQDFSNGSYIRFNKEKDKLNYDEGVVRIYHIDKELEELKDFRYDPFILNIASAYFGTPMYSSFIAFQHNMLSKTDTREYHVDYWEKEFKAFIYLDDVDLHNGPFAYIIGSNNAHITRYKKLLLNSKGFSDTSFFENDLGRWVKKEKPIIAKAGTLILADVVGFHRGLPQLEKTRSLLYNNIYSHNTEQAPDK